MSEHTKTDWPAEIFLVADQGTPWRVWRDREVISQNAMEYKRYVPAEDTSLLADLEAEVKQLRSLAKAKTDEADQLEDRPGYGLQRSLLRAEAKVLREDADRLQALLDKHKERQR